MSLRPTPALVRAVLLALVLLGFAALIGRPQAVIVAAPFVVYVAWAMLTPRRRLRLETSPLRVAAREGDAVAMRVRAVDAEPDANDAVEPGAATSGGADPQSIDSDRFVVTVSWPLLHGVLYDPPLGAVTDVNSEATATIEPDRWGRYTLGPPQVAVTDAARAWRLAALGPAALLVVRPAAASLVGASGVARPIGVAGVHPSSARGDGSTLADIREFRPGDRLRRVNWRVTSRTGRLHVNTTLSERDTDVLIVIDTLTDLPGAREGRGRDAKHGASSLDASVRAVAAISQHYVSFGDRVAVHDLGGRMRPVRVGTGHRQARLILDALSRIDRSARDFKPPRRVLRVSSGTLVFFCSPFLDDAVLSELVRLRHLGGEVIAVDTLPEGLGDPGSLTHPIRPGFLTEAWVLRRLEREATLARVVAMGIPVAPWRGTASLGSVLLAMERARSAPRLTVRR